MWYYVPDYDIPTRTVLDACSRRLLPLEGAEFRFPTISVTTVCLLVRRLLSSVVVHENCTRHGLSCTTLTSVVIEVSYYPSATKVIVVCIATTTRVLCCCILLCSRFSCERLAASCLASSAAVPLLIGPGWYQALRCSCCHPVQPTWLGERSCSYRWHSS